MLDAGRIGDGAAAWRLIARSLAFNGGDAGSALAIASILAISLVSMVTLRLVLACSPRWRHIAAFSFVSVDLPRMCQWTSRPCTSSVSKSFDAASSAGSTLPTARPSGT